MEGVLKAPPDSTNSDLNPNQDNDNDSGSIAPSVSTPPLSKSLPFRDPYLPEDDVSILTPEHAFVQYQTRSEDQACQICDQPAVGFHHRAYVCEACKKFFMRHTAARYRQSESGGPAPIDTVCPMGGQCRVEGPGRGKCPHCRYRKCLDLGMTLTPPGGESGCDISQIPCRVCGGPSSGFHFGALTCEGCKGFFRRTILSNIRLECLANNDCPITPANRNMCKSCRFQRCLAVGMSKSGSRIGRQPNAIKYYCAREISQLSTPHHGGGDSDNAATPSSSVPSLSNGGRSGLPMRHRNTSFSSDCSGASGAKGRSPASATSQYGNKWTDTTGGGLQSMVHSSTDQHNQQQQAGRTQLSIRNGKSTAVGLLPSDYRFPLSASVPDRQRIGANCLPTENHKRSSADNVLSAANNSTVGSMSGFVQKKRKLSYDQYIALDTDSQVSSLSVVHYDHDIDQLRYNNMSPAALSYRENEDNHVVSTVASSQLGRDWRDLPYGQIKHEQQSQRSFDSAYDSFMRGGSAPQHLEYSLPTPDTSPQISSTTTPQHDSRLSGGNVQTGLQDDVVLHQGGGGKPLLAPLAVHLPVDDNSLSTEHSSRYKLLPGTRDLKLLAGDRDSLSVADESSRQLSYHHHYHPASKLLYPNSQKQTQPHPESSATYLNKALSPSSSSSHASCLETVGNSAYSSARSVVDQLTTTVLQLRQQTTQLQANCGEDDSPNDSGGPLVYGSTRPGQRLSSPHEIDISQLQPHTYNRQLNSRLLNQHGAIHPGTPNSSARAMIPPSQAVVYPIVSDAICCKPELSYPSKKTPPPRSSQQRPLNLFDLSESIASNQQSAGQVLSDAVSTSSASLFVAAAAAAAVANALMVVSSGAAVANDAYASSSSNRSNNNTSSVDISARDQGMGNASKRSKLLSADANLYNSVYSSNADFDAAFYSLAKCNSAAAAVNSDPTVHRTQLPASGVVVPVASSAAVRAAAAAAAAAAATAAGLVLSNSRLQPQPADTSPGTSSPPSPPPPPGPFAHALAYATDRMGVVMNPLHTATAAADEFVTRTSLLDRPIASTVTLSGTGGKDGGGKNGNWITLQEFASGIRTATKYMMSHRKNIRDNLPQPCRPMHSLEHVEDVWKRMMDHFQLHSKFIVYFVKHLPGFEDLPLGDKRQLVRGAMYPLMLLELSMDYDDQSGLQYNYFDFTENERDVILKHFPTFKTIIGHLMRSGEALKRVHLDNVELTLLCAQEVFKNFHSLCNPTAAEHLYNLSCQVLSDHIASTGQPFKERLNLLRRLSPLMEELNLEHHQVIAQLRQDKPQLIFPELYTEMFQLTDAEEQEHQQEQQQQQLSTAAVHSPPLDMVPKTQS